MKKLMLIAGLCSVAAALAPIASASAAPLVGTCKIEGKAAFAEKLEKVPNFQDLKYSFKSEAVEKGEPAVPGFPVEVVGEGKGVECEETATKGKLYGTAVVTGGEAELACGAANGLEVEVKGKQVAGDVKLLVSANGKPPFKEYGGDLKFVAVGSEVEVTIQGDEVANVAGGDADFVGPGGTEAKEDVVEECNKNELKELSFYAVVVGTVEAAS